MSNWLNKAKARVNDLVSNPGYFSQMVIDQLGNYNSEVTPTITGGELTNRPYSDDETLSKGMDLATGIGPGVVKAKGGNWTPGAFQGVAEFFGSRSSNPDVADWSSKVLSNYLRKQMGTPEDPIRALADKGITHMPESESSYPLKAEVRALRKESGYPPRGMAQTPEAKNWENRSDSQILSLRAPLLKEALEPGLSGRETGIPAGVVDDLTQLKERGRMDWLGKVPGDAVIHTLRRPSSGEFFTAYDLGLSDLTDAISKGIEEGTITPGQLRSGSFNMEAAVRHAHNLRERSKKAADDHAIHSEYSTGHKIVELNKEGQFDKESDAMRHSVRGYEPNYFDKSYGLGGYQAIREGKAKVYSVRSPSGKSLATIEVDMRGPVPRISQIKGRLNKAPSKEAIPIIQDFIAKGGFVDVGDADNAQIMGGNNLLPLGEHR